MIWGTYNCWLRATNNDQRKTCEMPYQQMLREQKYKFKLKIEFRYKVLETHLKARMEQANG